MSQRIAFAIHYTGFPELNQLHVQTTRIHASHDCDLRGCADHPQLGAMRSKAQDTSHFELLPQSLQPRKPPRRENRAAAGTIIARNSSHTPTQTPQPMPRTKAYIKNFGVHRPGPACTKRLSAAMPICIPFLRETLSCITPRVPHMRWSIRWPVSSSSAARSVPARRFSVVL